MLNELINILESYKKNEKKIDSVEAIFRLFITNEPNGELLIFFIEKLKLNYPECQLKDINFAIMYEVLKKMHRG